MSSEHRKYWSDYTLSGLEIEARPYDRKNFPTGPSDMPPYFWKDSPKAAPVTHRGYSEARSLIGSGTVSDIENLSSQAVAIITRVFSSTRDGPELVTSEANSVPQARLVEVRLSSSLEAWKNSQRELGNILPAKKFGLAQASSEVLDLLKATEWPDFLQTNNALFGVGILNMLMGAADAPTLFSNYVTDMMGYSEHGYDLVFPSFKKLVEKEHYAVPDGWVRSGRDRLCLEDQLVQLELNCTKGLSDPYALGTLGGSERRVGVRCNELYVLRKSELEKRHKSSLTYRVAKLSRREAQIILFSDVELTGTVAETIARGYDAGAVMADMVFVRPQADVVDVGSDILNSEVVNTFLISADITDTGEVSEDTLRRIYDAYAASGARMLTERWYEPVVGIIIMLYPWHMQNDRHRFLRRAILGWPKARKIAAQPQREADFDEAFDQHFHTTGFWRPLDPRYHCDGRDTCDQVKEFLGRNDEEDLLRDLWWFLVLGPLEYVRAGRVDESQEEALVEGTRLQTVRLFIRGLVREMLWLIAHATHHAWQVNYLLEAAMFGSILDGGELIGKLDRYEDLDQ